MKIYLYELLNKYKGSIYVLKSELKGKSDIKVYKFAQKNNLTILTFDTDFLDINTYPLKGSSRTVLRFKSRTNCSNLKSTERIRKQRFK
ncbi:DUF5615 family PIN-like protein [Persephonella sp.]